MRLKPKVEALASGLNLGLNLDPMALGLNLEPIFCAGDLSGAHILEHLPSPIQVGYLGYPGPKLAPFVNCSLWDRFAQPPGLFS